MAITTSDPIRQDGRIVPGSPARFAATLAEALPDGEVATLRIAAVGSYAEDSADVVSVAMDIDDARTLLSCTLTVAQVTSIVGTSVKVGISFAHYRITTGADDSLLSLFAGSLSVRSKWDGVTGVALTAGASEAQAALVAANAAQAAQSASEVAQAAAESAQGGAETAQAAAEVAQAAAEAVPTTTDGIVTALVADPGSGTSAALSSTFGRVSAIPRARGAVVFTWDDGYPNWLAIAQAASARGQKHTFGVTTSRIGITGGITSADVAAIHALGHEIASHSVDHDVIPNDTAAQRVANYDNSKTTLEGIVGAGKVTTWIYPYGSPNGRSATTDQELLGRYDRLLDTSETPITPIADRFGAFLIPRYGNSAAAHDYALDMIRYAATRDVIICFYAHNPDGIVGGSPDLSWAQMLEQMDLCNTLGVPCLTAAEAFPRGNLLQNANFQTGTLGAWRTAATTGASLAVIPGGVGVPIPGSYVGEITLDTAVNANGYAYFRQLIPVEPGKEYTLGLRARFSSAGTVPTGCGIAGRMGRSTDYAGAVSGYDGTTGYINTGNGNSWIRLTSTFTVPAGRRFIEPALVFNAGGSNVGTIKAEFAHAWFGESKFGNFA